MPITQTATLASRLASVIAIDDKGIGNTWPVYSDPVLFADVVSALQRLVRDLAELNGVQNNASTVVNVDA